MLVCIAGAAFLAVLAWAPTTQLGWAMGNKPIQVERPPGEIEATPETNTKENATGVVGTVRDDTREAMAKAYASQGERAAEKIKGQSAGRPSPER